MMWADRTAIGLTGIIAVAIALTLVVPLVIDHLSYNPFLTTDEPVVPTPPKPEIVRLEPGSKEWLECRENMLGKLGLHFLDSAGRWVECGDVPQNVETSTQKPQEPKGPDWASLIAKRFSFFLATVLVVILPLWLVLRIIDWVFGGPARRRAWRARSTTSHSG
jgi:hypothetical protein